MQLHCFPNLSTMLSLKAYIKNRFNNENWIILARKQAFPPTCLYMESGRGKCSSRLFLNGKKDPDHGKSCAVCSPYMFDEMATIVRHSNRDV